MDSIKATLTRILLDPANHDLLAILKGTRNGLVYGAKIRFPHALVMTLLFRSGPLRARLLTVLRATRTHAINLASFVTIYKLMMYLLARGALPFLTGKKGGEHGLHAFIAGLVGGYVVFGRDQGKAAYAVNQQIVLYVFARVALALAKYAVATQPGTAGGVVGNLVPKTIMGRETSAVAWPVFASVCWGSVMYMFRWHPETVQPSLRSSMTYLYVNSDKWTGWKNFLLYNL